MVEDGVHCGSLFRCLDEERENERLENLWCGCWIVRVNFHGCVGVALKAVELGKLVVDFAVHPFLRHRFPVVNLSRGSI